MNFKNLVFIDIFYYILFLKKNVIQHDATDCPNSASSKPLSSSSSSHLASPSVSLSIQSKPPNFRSGDSFLTYFIFIKIEQQGALKRILREVIIIAILFITTLSVLLAMKFSIGKLLSWDTMTRHTQAVSSF